MELIEMPPAMMPHAMIDQQQIYPDLTYNDVPAAIDWLGRIFGFELASSYPVED
jgi:hypothetical protein